MKVCTKCKVEQPETEFHRHCKRYLKSHCKTCDGKRSREWYGRRKVDPEFREKRRKEGRRHYWANKEKRNIYGQAYRVGVSQCELKLWLKSQEPICAICQCEPLPNKRLAIDHCHETKQLRGLLCFDCNTALGKFKDSPKLLARAIAYLQKE